MVVRSTQRSGFRTQDFTTSHDARAFLCHYKAAAIPSVVLSLGKLDYHPYVKQAIVCCRWIRTKFSYAASCLFLLACQAAHLHNRPVNIN
eukprot:scaffold666372_cov73-Prasinocladus_malaysianus.AAC.1